MAALRSAPGGNRLMSWRDWVLGYLLIWTLPLPFGLVLTILAILWRWPFEAMGTAIPLETPFSILLAIGAFLLMIPTLSWMGLLFSIPIVWLVLRLGIGGWITFTLGGAGIGLLAAEAFGGMSPEIPLVFGTLSALGYRWLLGKRHPSIFDPCARPGKGNA